jgi:hypothetical protein
MNLPDVRTPRWVWLEVGTIAFIYAAASFAIARSIWKGRGLKATFWLLLANIPFVAVDVLCLIVYLVYFAFRLRLPWLFMAILLPYVIHAVAFVMGWVYLYQIRQMQIGRGQR